MAHFAKIALYGKVLTVLTVDDKDCLNNESIETESVGQKYLEKHNNWPAMLWIQTSYNTFENKHLLGGKPLRGNYAGIGYTWDEDNQIFWPPSPFNSWIKHIPTASWKSPIGDSPALSTEQQSQNAAKTHKWSYSWNEENQSWNLENML